MMPLRFIHIPKTGGISVRTFLKDNDIEFYYGNEPKHVGKHRYASYWRSEESYKFTIVRNPYARVVSYYNYTTSLNWNPTFEEFVKGKLINERIKIPSAWIPQTTWIYENNISFVNKIFKLEDNLEEKLNSFLKIRGNLLQKNVSTYDNYELYYTEELKDLIVNYFEDDFKLLGYQI